MPARLLFRCLMPLLLAAPATAIAGPRWMTEALTRARAEGALQRVEGVRFFSHKGLLLRVEVKREATLLRVAATTYLRRGRWKKEVYRHTLDGRLLGLELSEGRLGRPGTQTVRGEVKGTWMTLTGPVTRAPRKLELPPSTIPSPLALYVLPALYDLAPPRKKLPFTLMADGRPKEGRAWMRSDPVGSGEVWLVKVGQESTWGGGTTTALVSGAPKQRGRILGLLVGEVIERVSRVEGERLLQAMTPTDLAKLAVSIKPDRVDRDNEGRLVHVSGAARVKGALTDDRHGVTVKNALRLERRVEMYQWKETVETRRIKKMGGKVKKIKTYRYLRAWAHEVIDSRRFRMKKSRIGVAYTNPERMPIQRRRWRARDARLGAFSLGSDLLDRIARTVPLEDALLPDLPAGAHRIPGGFFRGEDPKQPRVGDLRVQYRVVPATSVTVLAGQRGDGFAPFQAPGQEVRVFELKVGTLRLEDMLSAGN